MRKLVRPAYPTPISGVIICLIFILTWFFSYHIFDITFHEAEERQTAYLGMFLVGVAVIITTIIIWEELMFPIMVKQNEGTLKVRNRRSKLQMQALLYLIIPVIFAFIYFKFQVNIFYFTMWAGICLIAPLVQKIARGINNYNDYLKLSSSEIEYKNNKKEGKYSLAKVEYIRVVKDSNDILSKLKLGMHNSEVTIDLDEMELEAFYDTIQDFLQRSYKNLLR